MLVDLWNALTMTGGIALVIFVCIVLVLLPPSIDPAIRWKERNERKKGRWKDYKK